MGSFLCGADALSLLPLLVHTPSVIAQHLHFQATFYMHLRQVEVWSAVSAELCCCLSDIM